MPTSTPDTLGALDKRALGMARLAAAKRRRHLIKQRVSAFAALVMVVVWAVILANTWDPQLTGGGPAPAAAMSPAVDDDDDDDYSSASVQPAPSPAPVVSSQS